MVQEQQQQPNEFDQLWSDLDVQIGLLEERVKADAKLKYLVKEHRNSFNQLGETLRTMASKGSVNKGWFK